MLKKTTSSRLRHEDLIAIFDAEVSRVLANEKVTMDFKLLPTGLNHSPLNLVLDDDEDICIPDYFFPDQNYFIKGSDELIAVKLTHSTNDEPRFGITTKANVYNFYLTFGDARAYNVMSNYTFHSIDRNSSLCSSAHTMSLKDPKTDRNMSLIDVVRDGKTASTEPKIKNTLILLAYGITLISALGALVADSENSETGRNAGLTGVVLGFLGIGLTHLMSDVEHY